ncbi:MAG: DUF4156 domain-containing protein [Bacteriovoracaceae bacterium]|nr:DUF4156 domain-containing protein [Bacteriovoracaceae bacterium]
MRKVLQFALLLSAFACAGNPYKLTEDGIKVKVSDKKPKRCEVLGRVTGISEDGERQAAINVARNKAAEKGADKLYLNDETQNGSNIKVKGTAYKCR